MSLWAGRERGSGCEDFSGPRAGPTEGEGVGPHTRARTCAQTRAHNTCTRAHTLVCIHVCRQALMHTCAHTKDMRTCAHAHICTHTRVHKQCTQHMHMCARIHTCAYMHAHMHMRAHTLVCAKHNRAHTCVHTADNATHMCAHTCTHMRTHTHMCPHVYMPTRPHAHSTVVSYVHCRDSRYCHIWKPVKTEPCDNRHVFVLRVQRSLSLCLSVPSPDCKCHQPGTQRVPDKQSLTEQGN